MRTKPQDDDHVGFSGWRLLGLGFWQAWWMISMCTDVLLPTTDRFPFAGNTTLWVLVLTTVGYLVVVALARRLSPFLTHRASFLAAGGLTAAGTVTLPIALTLGSGAAGFAWFLAGTVSLSLGNALLLIMWGELWSALATGRVGRHLYVSYTFAFVLFFVAYALPEAAAVAFTAALPIVSAAVLVAPSAAEPIALYRPVIPAMVAGLILLLLLPAPYRFLGAGLVIMGVYCLDMFMMLVSTDVAFRGRIPVALSFGLVILCARTGTLIGSFAADQLLNAALWSEALRSEVFLVGVLALVLVGMLFFTQTDVQKLYATSREETADASLEQKCAAIARMCRLTNREAEVLVLLARGRTVRYICDELSIAQGTAKHHVSNIYRKVGVFDRQGLLDTIEQGGVGKPGWE